MGCPCERHHAIVRGVRFVALRLNMALEGV